MSKHNNVNPDHYKQGGRERQGDGIIHGHERDEFEHTRARTPHIPNQDREPRPPSPSGSHEEPDTADESPEAGPTLSDDEGVPD